MIIVYQKYLWRWCAGVLILLFTEVGIAQKIAPSWESFIENKANGTMHLSAVNDFSYSGYHMSEIQLPDVSTWNTINVTDYGATPDDLTYDGASIQNAIDAAEGAGVPTVVLFPAGKFLLNSKARENVPLIITGSHIVLKGAGSGPNGTQLHIDEYGDMAYKIQFKSSLPFESNIASISKRINKGDFTIEVNDASKLSVGMGVSLHHSGIGNLEVNAPNLVYKDVWRIKDRGVTVDEKHIIKRIEGNMVTFQEPVQFTITADLSGATLDEFSVIEEVGMEGFLLTSEWVNHPEQFVHHKNDIVDYAWRALSFDHVKNGWIRDIEFKDWNENLWVDDSHGVTVKDILISGKQGHTSYYARYSYGVLFENCKDIVSSQGGTVIGQWHGPGLRWSTVNTVFKNCEMATEQSIDCHGFHPYSNLLDNVRGGAFHRNGGAENSYPNSGPDLTFWNFTHDQNGTGRTYDFWDPVGRKLNTYMYPKFVGFQAPGESITFLDVGLDELSGQMAYPNSLFDAQLQLRLHGVYYSASSELDTNPATHAFSADACTRWSPVSNGTNEWLMIDFGNGKQINKIVLEESSQIIDGYTLSYHNGANWIDIETGSEVGLDKHISFPMINARRVRFMINSVKNNGRPVLVDLISAFDDNTESKPELAECEDDAVLASEDSSEALEGEKVNVYPVPFKDVLTVKGQFTPGTKVMIYGINGNRFYEGGLISGYNELRLDRLSDGIYVVVIRGNGIDEKLRVVKQ